MNRLLIVGAGGHGRSVAKEGLSKMCIVQMTGGSILSYAAKVEFGERLGRQTRRSA